MEPHVARVVRDATIKRTETVVRGAFVQAHHKLRNSRKSSRLKLMREMVDGVYKIMRASGVSLCAVHFRHPRYNKRAAGVIGTWYVPDEGPWTGSLWAQYSRLSLDGTGIIFEVRVSQHALERVAERLDTLDPEDLRSELAVAANSLLLAYMQEHSPQPGQHLKMPTENGIAIAVWGDSSADRYEQPITITTWIDYASMNPGSHWVADPWDEYEGDTKGIRSKFTNGKPALPIAVREDALDGT